MKLALALLLLAAPLSAQTPTNQKIVLNVVVTLVPKGATSINPTPVSTPVPPVSLPISTPAPAPTPTPTPTPTNPAPTPAPVTTTPPPSSSPCVNNYADAAKSMNYVSTGLIQVQQLYTTALAQQAISATAYSTGSNTLSVIRLDANDVRDLIRVGESTDVVAQNISFVSAEVGTINGLLGTTPSLNSSLTSLVASMQTNLGTASKDVSTTTCPAAVP